MYCCRCGANDSMLWPSLVVVVCGAIFLRLEMRRRRLTLCGRRDPQAAETTDGHVSQTTGYAAAAASAPATHFRPAGRTTNDPAGHRDMIGRRLPASHGQHSARLKPGFQPTQRTQHKERNEMTSLLERPNTAASDDGVCRWHAAKPWQTRYKI